MERILITGATCQVGQAVLQHFTPNQNQELYLSIRNKVGLEPIQLYFDLIDLSGTGKSLNLVDTLFLLRHLKFRMWMHILNRL